MSEWEAPMAAGRIVPFDEYLASLRRPPVAPILWRWDEVATALRTFPHGERGTLALVTPGVRDEGSAAPGLSLALQVVAPGARTTPHAHSFWHLYLVRAGCGTVLLGNSSAAYAITNGDTLLVPAWCRHAFENTRSAEPLVLAAIQNLPQHAALGTVVREEPDGSLRIVTADPHTVELKP